MSVFSYDVFLSIIEQSVEAENCVSDKEMLSRDTQETKLYFHWNMRVNLGISFLKQNIKSHDLMITRGRKRCKGEERK